MNKRGFTLVELLAVIAILAILVVLALPNVLQMFNNAKEGAFVTEIQEIVKTAQSQYVLDGGKGISYSYNGSGSCTTGEKKLDMQGTSALNYKIEIDSKGRVVKLLAFDDNYSYKFVRVEPTSGDDYGDLKIQNINAEEGAQGALVDLADEEDSEDIITNVCE